MIVDPNMDLAIKWANEQGPTPELPLSIQDISVRTKLILDLDTQFFADSLINGYRHQLSTSEKKQCLDEIAEKSKKYLSDIDDDKLRINISLRLWAGCLSVAKTIALETISGPNKPEYRAVAHNKIMFLAQNDPIFKAGAETAVDFKKSRNEEYSFEGIPEDSFLRS